MRKPAIGVDFDNTLIGYDGLMHRIALSKGLIGPDVPMNKQQVRNNIVTRPEGEMRWRELQATAYGESIGEAVIVDGAVEFLSLCRQNALDVYIVSHKTRYASAGPRETDLREAALRWMRQKGFFDGQKAGIRADRVFFESTRLEKCKRIRQLGCTHFIDDLEEVFLEESFPEATQKILFDPHGNYQPREGIVVARDWKEISDIFFGRQDPN